MKIFCRFFFAWCLFVWQLLSPRWTVTPSTFTLSTGSTETQSTGAAISSSTHPLWLIYFEFFRPYGFGSWGVGSAGFGKKMTVASRPNSLYGGYSHWSILNLNYFWIFNGTFKWMAMASRPNSLYGEYSYWSAANSLREMKLYDFTILWQLCFWK